MQENQPTVNQSTVNSEQSTVSTSAPSTVHRSPNSFLIILLSILLIISVVIAGFFAYQTQKLVNELRVMSDELKQTPTPIASAEPTADPTANWKTYTSQKGQFEIQYPISMEIGTRPCVYDCINIHTKGTFSTLTVDFGISVSDKSESQVLEDYNGGEGMDKFTVTVAGQKVTGYSGLSGEGGAYPFKIFVLNNNNKTYLFDINNNVKSTEIDQILSTFRFIN